MKKSFFIGCLFLFCHFRVVLASEEIEIFNRANKLYMDQSYEQAASEYEKLVAMKKVAPEIYFNLGNAYYKTGNLAGAILNYERAKRLRPADPDIAYNLRMANLNTIDKIEPVPLLFYEKWWNDFVNNGSVSNRAMWAVILFWCALLIAAIYLFSNAVIIRKISFFLTLMLLISASFTLYLTIQQHRHLTDNRAAIIFEDSAYAKSSPDEKSANLFLLHAGTRIEVLDELHGWRKIRIANGNEGWISASSIEII